MKATILLVLNSVLLTTCFKTQQIKLNSGKVHKMKGSGPPVIFSTGFYGSMPSLLYDTLLNEVAKDFTVIYPRTAEILTKDVFEDISEAINVDKVGFISHSALDYNILKSDRLHSAILIDPVTVPEFYFSEELLTDRTIETDVDILQIKTDLSQDTKIKFIPDGFNLNVKNKYIKHYPDSGHCDLMNDMWAESSYSYHSVHEQAWHFPGTQSRPSASPS